ncbi:metallophosphoesterase [Desulfatibacillum aliphaticivorans]|uniref:metallophosphoesterase n=1 Tax=Desulfatibacillum aliphaticivorans TaxID=218208 RepID=UPI000415EDC2|nr:metallophosphoesterase [Desulfatibacillum aliphaticivorans]
MFFVKLLTIWTAFHFYVFWRISSIPFVSKRIPRQYVYCLMFVAWGAFLGGHALDRLGVGKWAYPLEFFGAEWMGVMLLLWLCFGVVDVLTGFGLWLKRFVPGLRTAAFICASILSAAAMFQGMRPPVISEHEVVMPGLPAEADGLTAAVISDTHLGSLVGKGWMEKRVEQIHAMEPDIIFAVGDIIEGRGDHEWGVIPALQMLKAPLGVWGVTGNHESYGSVGTGANFLMAAGMNVLTDHWREVRPGLILAGVDDVRGYNKRTSFPNVEKALKGIPEDAAVIFLSHRPDGAQTAAKAGADLMLSGHTHGGQIWPFGFLVKREYPLFIGRYQVDGMAVIVCRGTGTWGPRMRLWRPGEILKVVLRSDQAV